MADNTITRQLSSDVIEIKGSVAELKADVKMMPRTMGVVVAEQIVEHVGAFHKVKGSFPPKANGDRAALMSLLKYALYVIGAAVVALGGKALL